MWTLLWAVALVPPTDSGPRTADTLGPIDLDGDRLRESVQQTDAGVVVGKSTVPCGSVAAPCEIEVHDILMEDRTRELLLCEPGDATRTCRLFRMRDKALLEVKLKVDPEARSAYSSGRLRPPKVSTKGDGGLVAHMPGGWCPHDEPFEWNASVLIHKPPEVWTCDAQTLTPDVAVPLHAAVRGEPLGAVAQIGVEARILAESVAHEGWVQVALPTGEQGWVKLDRRSGSR